ncbi:hypothetical protein R1flu_000035 [Riccia fluitans]|uniref:Nucleobase-ascorbate transporter 12 n=1 Tax=Riccia fluitans TaxID=41844 RepID=A0ABD1XZB9_9MARC
MAVPSGTSPPHKTLQAPELDPESPSLGKRPGPWPPRMEPLPADHSFNPKALGTWARRTGYKSNLSGESASTASEVEIGMSDNSMNGSANNVIKGPHADQLPNRDLENGAQTNGHKDHEKLKPPPSHAAAAAPPHPGGVPPNAVVFNPQKAKASSEPEAANHPQNSGPFRMESARAYKQESEVDMMSQSQDADDALMNKHSHMKYEIRERPGLVPLIVYGIQHYLSIVGSLILIPLVIVPAAGGTDEDVAKVISTMLLVSGISTLLHSFFGSRLPLIQGASFVYLAPALAIIYLPKNISRPANERFKHTMRDLQGAVIISSLFQLVVGYSGLMSILLRAINPVVVAPTVAAVGLAFFTYGFPYVGTCVEIGIPQILVVLIFALYLRRVSIFGHKIFQVYAVPLGLAIVWAYAFLLTETGNYDYEGCTIGHPPRNGTVDLPFPSNCTNQLFTQKQCRTDISHALSKSSWFRVPYPFQWGSPSFDWKTGIIMIAASVIASVDSVGSYHATSLLVASRAPTPGVVSRSIGLEGLTCALAGLWGTGAGATTLTENVHTIAVTKMGSRRAVQFGATVLIVLSLVGKIGGFLATIPQVIVAALLVIMWTMLAALGLSNLRYSETGSSRNVLIVGLSLFLSLSIPAYFQQYDAGSASLIFEQSYFPYYQQFTVSSHGPIKTSSAGLNDVLNTVLSLHMVIAFLVAFILDNTVPGSKQERGTYIWTKATAARNEPAVVKDYGLPFGLGRFFSWVRWVGM